MDATWTPNERTWRRILELAGDGPMNIFWAVIEHGAGTPNEVRGPF
jgi:hypothetical protein